jgi:hypothetical protein
VPASVALRAAIVIAVMTSPFVGCFAATVIRSSLCSESLVWGRSSCHHCGQRLTMRDLIPVLSWLMVRGRCRSCRTPIPLIYLALELAFLGTALWASQNEEPARILPGMLLGWILIALFAFDVTAFVLPNVLTYALLLSGLGNVRGGERRGRLREHHRRGGWRSKPSPRQSVLPAHQRARGARDGGCEALCLSGSLGGGAGTAADAAHCLLGGPSLCRPLSSA